jgi:hypothetical protein
MGEEAESFGRRGKPLQVRLHHSASAAMLHLQPTATEYIGREVGTVKSTARHRLTAEHLTSYRSTRKISSPSLFTSRKQQSLEGQHRAKPVVIIPIRTTKREWRHQTDHFVLCCCRANMIAGMKRVYATRSLRPFVLNSHLLTGNLNTHHQYSTVLRVP